MQKLKELDCMYMYMSIYTVCLLPDPHLAVGGFGGAFGCPLAMLFRSRLQWEVVLCCSARTPRRLGEGGRGDMNHVRFISQHVRIL